MDRHTMGQIVPRVTEGPLEQLSLLVEINHPDPELRRSFSRPIGRVFGEYLRSDFDEAGEWLASQPLGPRYDLAIQQFTMAAARFDPEAARLWAEEISDDGLRATTLANPEFRGETTVVRPQE